MKKRFLSALLALAVAAACLTGCGGENKTEDKKEGTTTQATTTTEGTTTTGETTTTTAETTVSEQATTTTTTTAATTKPKKETGSQSTGSYTYTIYGDVTVTMDVDINKYIFEYDGNQWFDFVPMVYDLGWAGANKYTVPNWGANDGSTKQDWYTYHSGDMVTRIDLYGHKKDQSLGGRQYGGFSIRHSRNNGDYSEMYYEDVDSNPLHMILSCDVQKHYDSCKYKLAGPDWYASYDDIVLLTYIFWSEAKNPGNNPPVLLFGTDSRFCTTHIDIVKYKLP